MCMCMGTLTLFLAQRWVFLCQCEYRAGWRVSVGATLGRFDEAREVDMIVVVSITLAVGEIARRD